MAPDDMVLFGSRKLIGLADTIRTEAYLEKTIESASLVPLSSFLSKLYAFDMMIFNEDRHFGNYMFIQDGLTPRPFAFDFGRGLFWSWPFLEFPAPTSYTRVCGRILRNKHGFDLAAAESILDRLAALSTETIEEFVKEMPRDWLAPQRQAEFLDWWSGRSVRLASLRKGLQDESLL